MNETLARLKKLFPKCYINLTWEINCHYSNISESRSPDQLEWRLWVAIPFGNAIIKETFPNYWALQKYVKNLKEHDEVENPLMFNDVMKQIGEGK